MYLFTAGGFTGTLRACNEGVLSWVDKAAVPALPMWEGDKIFFRLLAEDAPFFLLKLRYEGDTLVEAALNGAPSRFETRTKREESRYETQTADPSPATGARAPAPDRGQRQRARRTRG